MHVTFIKWNGCHKCETPDLALLELRAFPSFWPPIGHTYAWEMLCRSSLLLSLKCVSHTVWGKSLQDLKDGMRPCLFNLAANAAFKIKSTFWHTPPPYCFWAAWNYFSEHWCDLHFLFQSRVDPIIKSWPFCQMPSIERGEWGVGPMNMYMNMETHILGSHQKIWGPGVKK